MKDAQFLSKTFKNNFGCPPVIAANKISFDVIKGQILGIIGPNSAGKSTLLKMILGFTCAPNPAKESDISPKIPTTTTISPETSCCN
ncbi:MAG: ATP-binding cassette domain-containing protein [Desulfamplus sp.]|nr:ATP-binding cassette domain-containing protein [Desulfamplus sp.]